MSLVFSRITKKYIDFPVSATLADGQPTGIAGVEVAMLPYRSDGPDATTVWVSANFIGGVVSCLVAGPAASPTSAHAVVPATGGDLWARVVDNPEVDATFITRIDIIQD